MFWDATSTNIKFIVKYLFRTHVLLRFRICVRNCILHFVIFVIALFLFHTSKKTLYLIFKYLQDIMVLLIPVTPYSVQSCLVMVSEFCFYFSNPISNVMFFLVASVSPTSSKHTILVVISQLYHLICTKYGNIISCNYVTIHFLRHVVFMNGNKWQLLPFDYLY